MQTACRLLSVAESGYYEWGSRPPSARTVRLAWLTEQIRAHRFTRRLPRFFTSMREWRMS